MNRSNRNLKTHTRSLNEKDQHSPTTPPGKTPVAHSPILPKPSLADSVDFFNGPVEENIDLIEDLILPDRLSPLPSNSIDGKVYNTRKRSHEASVSFDSSPNSPYEGKSTAQPNTTNTGSSSSKVSTGKPTSIPGFVSKLYRMVDVSASNLIKWGEDGTTFVVTSPEEFSRQLNMYGFHKVPHLQQGSMAASAIGNTESTIWEFSHSSFIKNCPDLLINVRRKIGRDEDFSQNSNNANNLTNYSGSSETSTAFSTSSIKSNTSSGASNNTGSNGRNYSNSNSSSNNKVLKFDEFNSTAKALRQDLQFIQQQQNALRTDFQSLQRENQLLWNENLASRERHLQQQQVIDRILRFLASVFTADGKLLSSTTTAMPSINSSSIINPSSLSTGLRNQRTPLLLGNISGNEDELRRQVMELISGNSTSAPINDTSMAFHSLDDLENTTRDISKDISVVEDDISNALKTVPSDPSGFDDIDFSTYLNCQSLEE